MSFAASGRSMIAATAMAPSATPARMSTAQSAEEAVFDMPSATPRRALMRPRTKATAGRRLDRERLARMRRATACISEVPGIYSARRRSSSIRASQASRTMSRRRPMRSVRKASSSSVMR